MVFRSDGLFGHAHTHIHTYIHTYTQIKWAGLPDSLRGVVWENKRMHMYTITT